jgi:hypothetical protein
MQRSTIRTVLLGLAVVVGLAAAGGPGVTSAATGDVGDTPETATSISDDTEYAGYSIDSTDQDWFSISLASGDVLDVSAVFTQDATNPGLAVWSDTDGDGTVERRQYVNTYTDNETLSFSPSAAGDYYVQVYAGGGGGASDTYDLVVGDPASSGDSLDVGLELQQSAAVSPGDDVTISTYVNNRASQQVSGVAVDLYVDADDDGRFQSTESVANRTLTLPGGSVRTVTLTYANVGLAPGNYSYQTRASDGATTTRSFTNGTLRVNSTGATTFLSGDATVRAAPGDNVTAEYTVTNPTDGPTSVLVEYPNFPSNLTLESVTGDVSQNLLGSSPSGVVTTQLAPGDSATVTATFGVAADAPTGTSVTVTAEATVSADGTVRTNTTTTAVAVTERDPLVARFGGGDSRIDNLDILTAVNAANSGGTVGGQSVSNLDVLSLVNRANAQS